MASPRTYKATNEKSSKPRTNPFVEPRPSMLITLFAHPQNPLRIALLVFRTANVRVKRDAVGNEGFTAHQANNVAKRRCTDPVGSESGWEF